MYCRPCPREIACLLLIGIMAVLAVGQTTSPEVASVIPTTATAGTQVTFTGTGFDPTQGSGNVWLGSTYGIVVSWSDTQVVATVASGAKSGTAQILQNGVWSAPINFTVITPVVTTVTPTTATAGTQVTFTGTGFGATQGSGKKYLCQRHQLERHAGRGNGRLGSQVRHGADPPRRRMV